MSDNLEHRACINKAGWKFVTGHQWLELHDLIEYEEKAGIVVVCANCDVRKEIGY